MGNNHGYKRMLAGTQTIQDLNDAVSANETALTWYPG